MYRVPAEASQRLRGGVLYLAVALTSLAFSAAPSDARPPQKQNAHSTIDSPRYAAIVVDANTKATLRQANADSLRHPASLTKIMTLYLLFERLEGGKLKLNTPLAVSAEAASQAPTKLGLKPGQTIVVEDAIKALITKSANDAAVVIAEALAGSEDEFAKAMTRKARALGMTRTTYRNASGLPDDDQVTTARDQARLGIEIQERFPRYYRYFSLTNFSYRGARMRNHNRLLGQVAGVDGIKTGYTHASGFNLMTSVRRGGRHIVAAVLGGSTAAQRDAHMRGLIERHIVEASLKRPDMKVAQAPDSAQPRAEARTERRPEPRAEAQTERRPDPRTEVQSQPRSEPGAIPRIVIVPVVSQPSQIIASTPPASSEAANLTAANTAPIRAAVFPLPIPQLNAYAPTPDAGSAILEAPPLPSPAEAQKVSAEEPAAESTVTGNIEQVVVEPVARTNKRTQPNGTWAIQVGAFEHEVEAKHRLAIARSKAADLLSAADPYTEKTIRGDKTLYRARFTGLDRARADAVCKVLQRNEIACLALKI